MLLIVSSMLKAITIGVVGHTDHGKTSLVQCLTGINTNYSRTEKMRNCSVECVVAPMETDEECCIAFIDMPGHQQFLKNTIRGLSSVDMVILVIAADDGVMPQTIQHLELIRYFGIRHGFIVLSKVDLVDTELLELAELEAREAVSDSILNDMPLIPFSMKNNTGSSEIKACMKRILRNISGKPAHGLFRMWVDRVKSFPGIGTVACGTINSGTVSLEDPVVLLPAKKETKARSLEVHHKKVNTAMAGQRVGVNLPKISLNDVRCGMVVVESSEPVLSRFLNVELHVSCFIKDQQWVKLYIGTAVLRAMVVLMQCDSISPGETDLAQLRLETNTAVFPHDKFVITLMNEQTVAGGGRILEISRQRYRKAKSSDMIPFLVAMQVGHIENIIKTYLQKNVHRIVSVKEISSVTGLPDAKIKQKMDIMQKRLAILKFCGVGYCLQSYYDKVAKEIVAALEKKAAKSPLNASMNKEEIKNQLCSRIDGRLFNHVMGNLTGKKRIHKENHGYTVPGFKRFLTEQQNHLADELLLHAKEIELSPFSVGGFCKKHRGKFEKNQVRRVLGHLCKQGKMTYLGENYYIDPAAIETIKHRVIKTFENKTAIHLSDSKEILGYGRSKGERIFEHLDDIGFTTRKGDLRTIE